ncbi:uncharacterized protein LOC142321767 [Lycorma delicatula]|uniref:uncharacterized protein LOC142321767 n=1 Tax=Lycorma delicatula TaxID=130591 RepID=UPI003F512530
MDSWESDSDSDCDSDSSVDNVTFGERMYPLMEWRDTAPLWIWSSDGKVPPNAVAGGFDKELLFVGRFIYKSALTPGSVYPSKGVCCAEWGYGERKNSDYEVLCGCNVVWIPDSKGSVPAGALPAGKSEYGETLYVGRVQYQGVTIIGKVHKSHRVCYFAYNGLDLSDASYEVLLVK